jgi:hypothetical protein
LADSTDDAAADPKSILSHPAFIDSFLKALSAKCLNITEKMAILLHSG